jgi:hypothetical protein
MDTSTWQLCTQMATHTTRWAAAADIQLAKVSHAYAVAQRGRR